jgi:hypothetical protein
MAAAANIALAQLSNSLLILHCQYFLHKCKLAKKEMKELVGRDCGKVQSINE